MVLSFTGMHRGRGSLERFGVVSGGFGGVLFVGADFFGIGFGFLIETLFDGD